MNSKDQPAADILEALAETDGNAEVLPNPRGLTDTTLMGIAKNLVDKGWVVGQTLTGDNTLLDLRQVHLTQQGRSALDSFRKMPMTDALPSNPVPLEQKREMRLMFMNLLYDRTGGLPIEQVDMHALGNEMGWDEQTTFGIVHYLSEEGLLEFASLGGGIAITHSGVVEIEEARLHPDAPTEHFAPVVNIINVSEMHQSQIQQGGSNNAQSQAFTIQSQTRDQLTDLMAALRAELEKVQLPEETRLELEADISTVEQQLNSPKPKPGIVRESLKSISSVLKSAESVTGSGVLIAEHWHKLQQLIPFI